MLAYKTQININDEFIYLKIPPSFKGKRVEIIVLETDETIDNNSHTETNKIESFYENYTIDNEQETTEIQKPNDFQKFLLLAPTWNDEQYQNFVETRKLFNQWKIA